MNIKKTSKEIWNNHKGKIIIGTVIVGGVVIYLLTKKGMVKTPNMEWVRVTEDQHFNTLETAIDKFKDLEKIGDVALFSERGTYAVLEL